MAILKPHGMLESTGELFKFAPADVFSVTGIGEKAYAHIVLVSAETKEAGPSQYVPISDLRLNEDETKLAEFLSTSLVRRTPARLAFYAPKRLNEDGQMYTYYTEMWDGVRMWDLEKKWEHELPTKRNFPNILAAWKQWSADWWGLKEFPLENFEDGILFTYKFLNLLEKIESLSTDFIKTLEEYLKELRSGLEARDIDEIDHVETCIHILRQGRSHSTTLLGTVSKIAEQMKVPDPRKVSAFL